MSPVRQRLLFIGMIVIGSALVVFFGIRFFHAFRAFNGHRPPHFPPPGSQSVETDVSLIREWMTIGYISQAYRLPPKLLYEALNIPPNGNERKSLKQLNDEYYPVEPGIVLAKVRATMLAIQPPVAPTAMSPNTAMPPSTVKPLVTAIPLITP